MTATSRSGAKLLFDESVAALDGETRSKLTQARYRAVGRVGRSSGRPVWSRSWLPAGAAAAVAVLSLMLWQGQVRAMLSDGSLRCGGSDGPRDT